MNRLLLSLILAVAGWGSVAAQTSIEIGPFDIDGTTAIPTGGLSFAMLDPVPIQATSTGTITIDYRATNSTGSDVTWSSVTATKKGDAASKFNASLGASSVLVPASSTADSFVDVVITSALLEGDIATVYVIGSAGGVPVGFNIEIYGTGAVSTGGLSITFDDPVPVHLASGSAAIDFTIANSTGSTVNLTGITASLAGAAEARLGAVMQDASMSIGATSSQSSRITLTTTGALYAGEVVLVRITGSAGGTPVSFPFDVYGTTVVDVGGLAIEFIDPVPQRIASGSTVLDFRVTNSGIIGKTLSSIAMHLWGSPKVNLTATPASAELNVPAGGSVTSSVTIEALAAIYDGQFIGAAFTGTTTDNAGSDFDVTITASRTTGDIPYGVHFSVLSSILPGNSDNDANRRENLHECHDDWSFESGLTVSAAEAHGPFNACVVSTAGTYTVSVTVYRANGEIGTGSIEVTGTDWVDGTGSPARETYYVAPAGSDPPGSDSNNGTDPSTPWLTASKVQTELGSDSNFRLFFEGGVVHDMTALSFTGDGWRIGSYGSGKAILRNPTPGTGDLRIFQCSAPGNPANDWSIYNLTVRGRHFGSWTSTSTGNGLDRFMEAEEYDDATLWDIDGVGFGLFVSMLSVNDDTRVVMIMQDVTSEQNIVGGIGFGAGNEFTRSAFVDCTLKDSISAGHVMRARMSHALLLGCTLSHQYASDRHILKLHGLSNTGFDRSRWISIEGCTFGNLTAEIGNDIVSIGPQNNTLTEHVLDVSIRNCAFYSTATNPASRLIHMRMRNMSVINAVGIGAGTFLGLNQTGGMQSSPVLVPGGLRAFGCSWWTNLTATTIGAFEFPSTADAGDIGNEIRNCVFHSSAQTSTATSLIEVPSSSWLSNLEDSNNAGYSSGSASTTDYIDLATGTDIPWSALPSGTHGEDCLFVNPEWVDSTPDTKNDFMLLSTSDLIGAGISVPQATMEDAAGVLRGAAIDIGAFEYVP